MATKQSSSRQRHNSSTSSETLVQTDAGAVMPGAPGLPDMPIYQVTVGEQGHIVLPAALRHCCHLAPHEKLLIFRLPWATSVLLIAKIADIPELVRCFCTASHKTSDDRSGCAE